MGPQYILVFAVCFLASLLGPLCGIGGGVIIKLPLEHVGAHHVALHARAERGERAV